MQKFLQALLLVKAAQGLSDGDDLHDLGQRERSGRQSHYFGRHAVGHPVHHYPSKIAQYRYGYSHDLSSKEEIRTPDGIVKGSYSYLSPDGRVITNNYVADAWGFRSSLSPSGPVPLHPPVVRKLPPKNAYLAGHKSYHALPAHRSYRPHTAKYKPAPPPVHKYEPKYKPVVAKYKPVPPPVPKYEPKPVHTYKPQPRVVHVPKYKPAPPLPPPAPKYDPKPVHTVTYKPAPPPAPKYEPKPVHTVTYKPAPALPPPVPKYEPKPVHGTNYEPAPPPPPKYKPEPPVYKPEPPVVVEHHHHTTYEEEPFRLPPSPKYRGRVIKKYQDNTEEVVPVDPEAYELIRKFAPKANVVHHHEHHEPVVHHEHHQPVVHHEHHQPSVHHEHHQPVVHHEHHEPVVHHEHHQPSLHHEHHQPAVHHEHHEPVVHHEHHQPAVHHEHHETVEPKISHAKYLEHALFADPPEDDHDHHDHHHTDHASHHTDHHDTHHVTHHRPDPPKPKVHDYDTKIKSIIDGNLNNHHHEEPAVHHHHNDVHPDPVIHHRGQARHVDPPPLPVVHSTSQHGDVDHEQHAIQELIDQYLRTLGVDHGSGR